MIEDLSVDRPWLMLGDCLERMTEIPDGSVDAIICDLPYGTTNCAWDTVIPFDPLWKHYKRVIKRNGAVVLTASQPFASALVMSNPKWFRYDLVWDKVNRITGALNAARMPMRQHESVLVFYERQPTYNPQWLDRPPVSGGQRRDSGKHTVANDAYVRSPRRFPEKTNPFSIIAIPGAGRGNTGLHPTQKPVLLMEYLILTYTNEGQTVLDNCAGSFSTGVASVNTGRCFIGIEKDPHYFELGRRRIEDAIAQATEPAIPGGLFDSLAV